MRKGGLKNPMKFLLLTGILYALAFSSFAKDDSVVVGEVEVTCLRKGGDCSDLAKALSFLKRPYSNMEHLERVIELYVLNEGIYSFEYELKKMSSQSYGLAIKMGVKEVLDDYTLNIKGGSSFELPTVLPLREGDYVDARVLEKNKALILESAESQGYPEASLSYSRRSAENGVLLKINIDPGAPVLVEGVRIHSDSPLLGQVAKKALSRMKNKSFHLQKIKNILEELRQLFIGYGYYLNDINLNYERSGPAKVVVDVAVKGNELHVFYPSGNSAVSDSDIKSALKNSVLAYKRKLPAETVANRIKALYARRGYVDVFPKVVVKTYRDNKGETVNRYDIQIKEGARARIEEIRFNGNSALSSKTLRAAFYGAAPDTVKNGYFQRDYFENFVEIIREEYILRGYVNVLVEEPRARFFDGKVYLNYRLREGVKAVVSDVSVTGAPGILEREFLRIMTNKKGTSFNPVSFKKDLEMIENRLRQEGYYFARIKNKNSPNIVSYKNENSNVYIEVEIDPGERLVADQIIIIGNRKTKNRLIRRELALQRGDLVTRDVIQISQTNLLGLGIFNSVLIEPIPGEAGTADILVSVREKDFGVVELAPGIRTDIGLKLSANVSYNNLEGLNKRISFKGRVNQRFNLNSLDERRREESSSLVEYDLAVNYAENHLFRSDVDFSASLSTSRKRFFSFDADIQRLNFTFNKDFTRWLSASVRPQFENIKQFDATSEQDEGKFQIGSVTPSVTADFRNNRINPTSGAWFNMSMEVANPALLSQDTQNLTINYYKFVSRNRFYLPFDGGTLAMSLSGGIEENLAPKGEGYIPNIKVFRLNGADIVRGFEDDEINRLSNGQDISQVTVDNKAYMAVIKVEPRVFISDTSMFGVFYDAGRVFVDSFDAGELRSSMGITFKYLTPVGSLDFDYGIKLLRKTYDDGMVDSPGRLHVSIGFF